MNLYIETDDEYRSRLIIQDYLVDPKSFLLEIQTRSGDRQFVVFRRDRIPQFIQVLAVVGGLSVTIEDKPVEQPQRRGVDSHEQP